MDKFKLGLFKAKISWKKLQKIVSTDLTNSASENESELTAVEVNKVKQQIASLTTHPTQKLAIADAFQQALAQWQQQPEGNNSLVVLSSPVSPLTKVISESLTSLEANDLIETKFLSWQARLHDYRQIKSQLLSSIETSAIEAKTTSDSYKLIIISRLEWFFLRCIGGLETIETLRDLVASDSSCFWLIGCNSWAWQYLNKIHQINAYLTNTILLPPLQDEATKEWLEPATTKLNLNWQADNEALQAKTKEARLKHQELDEIAKVQQDYYEKLADISQGISNVVGDLWWRSLKIDPTETDTENIRYVITKPKLPDIPSLLVEDRYLLYSLLLHGGMSLAHLTASLGKNESIVKSRTQYLLQNGVIGKEQNLLYVNPAYYPKLKSLLSNNNFLVD